MKKMITLFAIAGMVLALAPAVHAQTVLMANGTNNGSFEGSPSDFPGPGTLGVWTFVQTIPSCGLWSGAPIGKDGTWAITANGGSLLTATTSDLLLTGTGYTTVNEGDEFSWSYIYNDGADTDQTVSFSLNFGGADVVVDSFTMDSPVNWQTRSGTYTATATDAAGGQLKVVLSVAGHTYTDKYELSVTGGGPVATPGTLIYGK